MDKKPWLEHYDEGVPHTLKPYPARTLMDVVSDTALQYAEQPILYFKGNSISYAELESLSNALATALVELQPKIRGIVSVEIQHHGHVILRTQVHIPRARTQWPN